jgi:hypothetical protein
MHASCLRPSHARPDVRLRQGRQGRRLQGHHRRRRRRGASAGHDGGADPAAGLRRARRIQGALRPGQPALDRADARPASRSARSPSARPARSTPPCSPPPCWRFPTMLSPNGSTPGAPSCSGAVAERPEGRRMSRRPDPRGLGPGAVLGILGGGQLARMLALAAADLGAARPYLSRPSPTARPIDVAARHTIGAYEDEAALAQLRRCRRCRDLRVRERAGRDRRLPRRPHPGASRR